MQQDQFIEKVVYRLQSIAKDNEEFANIVKDLKPFIDSDFERRVIFINTFLVPFKFSLDTILENMAKKYGIDISKHKKEYDVVLMCLNGLVDAVSF